MFVKADSINSGKSRSLENNQTKKNKEIKSVGLVLLSLFMRDNEKCNNSHAPPPWHRLERYSILNTKCIGITIFSMDTCNSCLRLGTW